jgi:tellurite resistance protein
MAPARLKTSTMIAASISSDLQISKKKSKILTILRSNQNLSDSEHVQKKYTYQGVYARDERCVAI